MVKRWQLLSLLFLMPVTVFGGLVADWNRELLDAVRRETTTPGLMARNFAIIHLAVFEAANAAEPRFEAYLEEPPEAAPEANAEMAAAYAAHTTATALFPASRAFFARLIEKQEKAFPEGDIRHASRKLGHAAAKAVLDLRKADGASLQVIYRPKSDAGQWRRTPPFFRPPESVQCRLITPFVIENAEDYRTDGPPQLETAAYAEGLNQVRDLGAKESTARTPEQTEIAHFWADFSYTCTPPGHWNEIAAAVFVSRNLPVVEEARAFALLNIAHADVGIAAWEVKYYYNFWRPVTALERADEDHNPETEKLEGWQSLLPCPAHPEYVSGHSAFSGAAATVIAEIAGTDKVTFTAHSDTLKDVTRSFDSLWKAAEECAMSRVYGGIHYRFSGKDGLALGRRVARDVTHKILLPLEQRM